MLLLTFIIALSTIVYVYITHQLQKETSRGISDNRRFFVLLQLSKMYECDEANKSIIDNMIITLLREDLDSIQDDLNKSISISKEDVLKDIINNIETPDYLRKLLRSGNFKEAEKLAKRHVIDDPSEESKYALISALISQTSIDKIEEAADYLLKNGLSNISLYIEVGFLLGKYKKYKKSIAVIEKANKLCRDDDSEQKYKLLGNLAYYYARNGDKKNEAAARNYAEKLFNKTPTPSRIDTLGVVKICYGLNLEEVQEGIGLCTDAFKDSGYDPDILEIHQEHLQLAQEKLKLFL